MIDAKLLDLLVCPVTKGRLHYKQAQDELWCQESGLAYPIRDDIPVMIESEARKLSDRERNSLLLVETQR